MESITSSRISSTSTNISEPASDSKLTSFTQGEMEELFKHRLYSDMFKERTGHQLLLTAHRGGGPTSVFGSEFPSSYLPENSLQSIKDAIIKGADAVEIDVFKSKDGKLMVTHDDEIYKNEFQADRTGQHLPEGESRDSYRISQKDSSDLTKIKIGHNEETIPTLAEVTELVRNANILLRSAQREPVVLNVELKDETAVKECVDFYTSEKKNDPNFSIKDIVFCSFKHEALAQLKREFSQQGLEDVRIAPGIKTKDLFGAENVNPNFSLRPHATYHENAVSQIKHLISNNGFSGPDTILWDIRRPLLDAAINGELHASTSDYRQYSENRDQFNLLLEISKKVNTFFKCDNVEDARKVLMESSILMNGIGIQMMHKQLPDGGDAFYFYQPHDQQDNGHLLDKGVKKPIAFSKLA